AVNTLGKKTVKSMITIEAVAIIIITSYLFTNGYIITSILALSGMIFGYIYSAEPIRVKKRGFLSPFPVLIGLYTLPVLGGWFIFHSNLSMFIIVFSIGYALINEGITLVNTCEDYDEDKSEGITTWAHLFSLRKTMKIAYIFTIVGGVIAVIGVFFKPIFLGWSFYNMYSSIIFVGMGVINTAIILFIGNNIIASSEGDDLKSSCKKAAKNMPKWFITTRYPLLLMSLLILL
ncbi:MAG: UbiA family prenyltransferase, partial [Thermoplasmata archaeon]